uniref:Translation elongation factor EFTu-like domain-containing protein n=1 Tax=Stomoxys calcitrans TaxID=35570 RepID=A0A1I8NQ15_STOCA
MGCVQRYLGLGREYVFSKTQGVGTVVSGTCLQGLIKLNDTLMLGPDPLGNFMPIAVKSIHRKRMNVKEVRGGQTASFALKKIKRSQIRKGMVMVSPELKPQACWEFEGEILVLHHPTTISSRYQAMVHCGSIRQTASIVNMSKECLRTGDKAHVKFRFIKHPEYIRPGQRMVFREGRTKAVGNVLKPITNSQAAQNRPKPNKMQSRTQGQGSSQHNTTPQNQNQNPNVQAAMTVAAHTANKTASDDLKSHKSEGVLEVTMDKRDTRLNTKRNNKRVNGTSAVATSNEAMSSQNSGTTANPQMAGKVQ